MVLIICSGSASHCAMHSAVYLHLRSPSCYLSLKPALIRIPQFDPVRLLVLVRLPLTRRPAQLTTVAALGNPIATPQPYLTVARSIGRKISSPSSGLRAQRRSGRSGHLVRPGQPHRTQRGCEYVGANQAAARSLLLSELFSQHRPWYLAHWPCPKWVSGPTTAHACARQESGFTSSRIVASRAPTARLPPSGLKASPLPS
jgi:hypothetical protein